jgi:outer membrane protein assembly factor BamE
MRARHIPVLVLAALFAGCKSVEVPKLPGVTPYRMVIQQGNFISDEMIAQLKPGMTKEQVRFVLGTPLVTDIFHADRWDYVFLRELPNGKREQRNLSVVFQDSKLVRVIGDILPDPNAPKPAPTAKPSIDTKPAAEPAKPAAEAPKPAPEPAKPAAAQAESWEPTKQNWGSATVEPEKPAPAARKEEEKKEGPKSERGFFGRLLDRIAPGSEAKAETKTETKAETPVEAPKPAAEAKVEEQKPAEEKKERGFFGRMLERIGL